MVTPVRTTQSENFPIIGCECVRPRASIQGLGLDPKPELAMFKRIDLVRTVRKNRKATQRNK